MICDDTISFKDLERLTETLLNVIQRIESLEEFEGWLRSQRCVESVKTADYLIKTEPPQKELLATFKLDDGSTTTKVIDVILYPDHTFGIAGLHDP